MCRLKCDWDGFATRLDSTSGMQKVAVVADCLYDILDARILRKQRIERMNLRDFIIFCSHWGYPLDGAWILLTTCMAYLAYFNSKSQGCLTRMQLGIYSCMSWIITWRRRILRLSGLVQKRSLESEIMHINPIYVKLKHDWCMMGIDMGIQ